MYENSILAKLIAEAVENCRFYGSGEACDEEMGTELNVRANWCEDEIPGTSLIEIAIYQGDVLKLSYLDPTTREEY